MNGLTIMIGQLGLVWLTYRKTSIKHANKLISRQLLIFLLINYLLTFVNMLSANWSTKQALIDQS